MITDNDWRRILSGVGVRAFTVEKWVEPFGAEVQLDKFSAGEADLIDWLPQILHESAMLECVEERLTYNPERIREVWPSRFPTVASAIPCSHNPQRLANTVYADRMGNGDYASGDGWKYRGASPIQLTGLGAYGYVGDLIGQDLVNIPELLLQPHYGLIVAIGWWEGDVLDSMLGDQVKLRRKVQGSNLGLQQVVDLRKKLVELFA
jgi:putative chitinase